MALTSSVQGVQSAEIAALRERVAELEHELARRQEIISSLSSSSDSVAERLHGLEAGMGPASINGRQPPIVHENQLSFRTLAVHSPMGIFQCDLEGNSLFVNNRYATIAGVSEHEMAGQGWLGKLHPQDRERVLAEWRKALGSRDEFYSEFRFLHDDGNVRWVWGNAVPLRDETGDVASYLGNILDITSRKQAKDALRASEQRFRLLNNFSPVGIFLSDEAGDVVHVNPRLQAIYGYDAPELLGIGFARVFHPDEREAELANWLKLASSTDLHDLDRRVINSAGELRWVHVRSAPMISHTGAVIGRVGTVEDITDRRRAEEQLRKSEELYRMLAEHSTDMISTYTADRVCRYVSPACRTLFGYEPEEMVGRNSRDFVHPDDAVAIEEARRSLAGPLGVATLTCRMRKKDGQYIWLEGMYKRLPGRTQENPEEIIGVSRDITVRRQAAEQLRESEARMRGILNTVSDGIVTVNESLMIEQFNPGAERLFGYAAEKVLGKHVRTLIPAARAAHFRSRADRLPGSRGRASHAREVIGQRKDGANRELEMRVGEMAIAGRRIYTAVLHDITERKRTEQMLFESEKLAATGRIAARIAHEINNPLAGIKNSFLLIEDAIPRDHPYFSYVARIESEIDRIARIVRHMFELHRPDRESGRPMVLDRTIRDVVALLGTLAPARKVTLDVETSGATNTVRLPEDSLRQVLYNIIVNAIEASPTGGLVKIRATLDDDTLEVFVSDNGEGISAERRSQIYEPFFTTKNLTGTGGLGLGLSISRGIVKAMQGTLDFESNVSGGTVFRISIPVRGHEMELENA